MKKGFTLIELLVVVLIIGILSSVALPQYTKAVEKARASEAMQILKSLRDAQSLCQLERGIGEYDGCQFGNGGTQSLGDLFDNISISLSGDIVSTIALDSDGIRTKNFIYGLITEAGGAGHLCAERTDDGRNEKYVICTSAHPNASTFNKFSCGGEELCKGIGFKEKDGGFYL